MALDLPPLRILLAVGSLAIGGTESQVVRLALELRSLGHDVTVLVYRSGPLAADLYAHGVPLIDVGFRGLLHRDSRGRVSWWATARQWGGLAGLPRRLARLQLDVVHAFLLASFSVVLPAAWLARVPRRVQGRRNLAEPGTAVKHRVAQWLANRCSTHIVANANRVAAIVRAEGVSPGRVHVIPNGVDIPEEASNVAKQPPRGVMIANLIAYKGHLDLIEALRILPNPPVVDCIGEGPYRAAIESALEDSGMAVSLRLTGSRYGAARAYQSAQFAVLPSHEEGLPNAVLEAMAAGLPVVATAVGDVPEVVEDGVTGYLVPPRAPEVLARAIARATEDPSARVRMGSNARALVSERYGWDRVIAAHLKLYRDA